ncbi:MAG: hypothetical protein E7055_04850 [Lentisphaerae bacterium]|nr:hypothetical protein [Lentisphaerota bacterium]
MKSKAKMIVLLILFAVAVGVYAWCSREKIPDVAQTIDVSKEQSGKLKAFALQLNEFARQKKDREFAKMCKTLLSEDLEENYKLLGELKLSDCPLLQCSENKLDRAVKNVYFQGKSGKRIHLVVQESGNRFLFRGLYVYAK